MSHPKVFEFAKEIGIETLVLMDKIREWKLPVRSHMMELDSDLQTQIKDKLELEKSPKKDAEAKPKKSAKKATAVDSEAAPAAGATAKTTAKSATPKASAAKVAAPKAGVAKKTVAKKSTAKVEPEVEDSKKPSGVVVKKAASKVVVRKKGDEESSEAADLVAESSAEVEVEVKPSKPAAPEVNVEKVAEVKPHLVAAAVETPEIARVEVRPEPIEKVTIDAKPKEVAQPPVAAAAESASATVGSAVTGDVRSTAEDDKKDLKPTGPARKKEITMTSHGPVSGVKSEAPRRNIVGRMDLSRVAPPPGSQGASRPFQGANARPGGVSVGSSGVGGRGLRAGFVSTAPAEIPTFGPDADRSKKFDDKRRKVGGDPAAAGPSIREREKEEELKTFSATDFRKREMVFQPKKKRGMLNRESKKTAITTPKASKRVLKINGQIKVSDLANEMGVKVAQVSKVLITNGVTATPNTDLDFDTVSLIVGEFGFEAVNTFRTVSELIETSKFGDLDADALPRSPVVTVMGHVDHGKTSLLDAIRKADVVSGEAGGITQHIGAYRVTTEDGHIITFIDTPGHEAFTAMRARGANVTDIAIIVVAADDGLMPQTAEAINHAKAAKVPIIVALNKMDKPGANPDRVKQQLTEFELVPEEWGGNTIYVPVSALKKTGISELLEQIYLVAEMGELKANPNRSATGVVIESRLDKGRGPVATLLVQDGTLKVGQWIVAGQMPGKIRALINDRGERVDEAGPSVPVEVLGLTSVPGAGDRFDSTEDERDASTIALARKEQAEREAAPTAKMSLEALFSKMQAGDTKELPIVLKSDVAGSAEAIKGMFEKLGTSEVKIKVIHSAIGGISESDVLLASTAKGVIVGFNVRPDGGAQSTAKRLGIEVKTYTIVYELMDDMKKAMSGLLRPDVVETAMGRAEVRNTFTVPKVGMIAGCSVVDGKITRQSQVRLVRDGKIVYTGKIGSLKRFKDDAKEVAQGFECGIGIENYNDLKVGDVIEAFSQESIAREL